MFEWVIIGGGIQKGIYSWRKERKEG